MWCWHQNLHLEPSPYKGVALLFELCQLISYYGGNVEIRTRIVGLEIPCSVQLNYASPALRSGACSPCISGCSGVPCGNCTHISMVKSHALYCWAKGAHYMCPPGFRAECVVAQLGIEPRTTRIWAEASAIEVLCIIIVLFIYLWLRSPVTLRSHRLWAYCALLHYHAKLNNSIR